MSIKKKFTSAALTGLLTAGVMVSQTSCAMKEHSGCNGKHSERSGCSGKHGCKGQNACKGQGGCATDKHACKGHNACKGQGGCATK